MCCPSLFARKVHPSLRLHQKRAIEGLSLQDCLDAYTKEEALADEVGREGGRGGREGGREGGKEGGRSTPPLSFGGRAREGGREGGREGERSTKISLPPICCPHPAKLYFSHSYIPPSLPPSLPRLRSTAPAARPTKAGPGERKSCGASLPALSSI